MSCGLGNAKPTVDIFRGGKECRNNMTQREKGLRCPQGANSAANG